MCLVGCANTSKWCPIDEVESIKARTDDDFCRETSTVSTRDSNKETVIAVRKQAISKISASRRNTESILRARLSRNKMLKSVTSVQYLISASNI